MVVTVHRFLLTKRCKLSFKPVAHTDPTRKEHGLSMTLEIDTILKLKVLMYFMSVCVGLFILFSYLVGEVCDGILAG